MNTLDKKLQKGLSQRSLARKTLHVYQIKKGHIGRLDAKGKVCISSSDPKIVNEIDKDSYVYPPEFFITTTVNNKDPNFEENILQNILEQEEDCWYNLIQAVAKPKPIKKFSFGVFSKAINDSTSCVFLGSNAYKDLFEDEKLMKIFQPISKPASILKGEIGYLGKIKIFTNTFRKSDPLVNEIIFFQSPKDVGGITQRFKLRAHLTKKGKRTGLFCEQCLGMAITNTKSIVRYQRA